MADEGFESEGGGAGLIADNFVNPDGTIQWNRLGATLSGGAILAFFAGITEVILAIFSSVVGLYDALGGFIATLIAVLVGTPGVALEASYAELEAYISTMGPLAFAASVASVLIIARIAAWGWNRGI